MPFNKTLELSLLVKEDDARDLLAELADDPRVTQATLALGKGKYLIPDRNRVKEPA